MVERNEGSPNEITVGHHGTAGAPLGAPFFVWSFTGRNRRNTHEPGCRNAHELARALEMRADRPGNQASLVFEHWRDSALGP